MALLSSIGAALSGKATATVGAAVLMVGGGVALAQGGMSTGQNPPGHDDAVAAIGENVDGEVCDEEQWENAAFCRGPSHPPGLYDPDEDASTNGDDEVDEVVAVEENGDDENGDDERSETAKRVHEALTGGDELKPGDEGFGEAVSQRARNPEVDLGDEVSKAARGENGDDEDDENDEDDNDDSGRRGPPEGVPAGPPEGVGPNR